MNPRERKSRAPGSTTRGGDFTPFAASIKRPSDKIAWPDNCKEDPYSWDSDVCYWDPYSPPRSPARPAPSSLVQGGTPEGAPHVVPTLSSLCANAIFPYGPAWRGTPIEPVVLMASGLRSV